MPITAPRLRRDGEGSLARPMTMVDLFAGAGGLSLGLAAAGFRPLLAVERSPMAAETYFRNLVRRDEEAWQAHVSLPLADQLRAGLGVATTARVLEHTDLLRNLFRPGDLDLLAGGPPCQGFSLAGLRNPRDVRNRLPLEFLEFVRLLRPRQVLVENVPGFGISFSPRPEEAALEQLRLALGAMGYLAQILEVNAADFGVAQERPRIMIAAMRRDLVDPRILETEDARGSVRWSSGRPEDDPPLLAPQAELAEPHRLRDAIGDLDGQAYSVGKVRDYPPELAFARELRTSKGYLHVLTPVQPESLSAPSNHEARRHSPRVTFRFRVAQALSRQGVSADVFFADGSEHWQSTLARLTQVQLPLRGASGEALVGPEAESTKTPEELAATVRRLATRKHSQRVLEADKPARTILTLPDDHVHYAAPRILTVREAARIQSFPDAFRFYSKATTGGSKRSSEVPQYSQVGNAVPPMMARAVGRHLRRVLLAALATSSPGEDDDATYAEVSSGLR